MKKAMMHLVIALAWCLYGVPVEEWNAMNDAQQEAVMDNLADQTMQELGCSEVEVSEVDEPNSRWVLICGECIEEQNIATLKSIRQKQRAVASLNK